MPLQTDTMTDLQLYELAQAALTRQHIRPGNPWLVSRPPPFTTIWFRANGDDKPHSVDLDHDGQVLRAS